MYTSNKREEIKYIIQNQLITIVSLKSILKDKMVVHLERLIQLEVNFLQVLQRVSHNLESRRDVNFFILEQVMDILLVLLVIWLEKMVKFMHLTLHLVLFVIWFSLLKLEKIWHLSWQMLINQIHIRNMFLKLM